MKKLLLLISLFVPFSVYAWESSVGIGYSGRLFKEKDELGSTTIANKVKPKYSNQLALNGSVLFSANSFLRAGFDLTLAYGNFYIQENITNLQIWTAIIALDIEYINKNFSLQLKPGFIVNGVTLNYTKEVDVDAGVFSLGLRASTEVFNSQRIFVEPQMIVTPQIGLTFATSPAIIVGIENIFKPKKVIQKVVEVLPVEIPKEITPIKLPEPATPVSLPALATETAKPVALKFTGENGLSDESLGFLEKVVKVHNSIPSIIKINYSRGENAKKKAEALYTWFIKYGVKENEVQIIPGLKGKEIRIEVAPK